MPTFRTGVVEEITESSRGLIRLLVRVGRKKRPATAFTAMTGPVKVGDKVVVNTTAVDLELGTGGEDFVLWNLSRDKSGSLSGGHIMKLRYTPWQMDTMAAEAPESPHHKTIAKNESLGGMPVVACGIHSQVAPVAAMIKHSDPDLNVAYVMTDGAALPISLSNSVATLKKEGFLDGTVTCGNSFGGDLECVNVYTGLIAASEVLNADITLIGMGPGIVGTSTKFGHTGMEQGQVISAAGALGGRPIAALRISFADLRERHHAVSHHTLTALRYGALVRCTIAVPDMVIEKLTKVMETLDEAGLSAMHDVRIVDSYATEDAIGKLGYEPTTMGRRFSEDPDFFEAAGAAGLLAVQMLQEGVP